MTKTKNGASPTASLILIDYLYSTGHDAEQWLVDAGLDVTWLNLADNWLPETLVEDIWRVILEKSNNELLGLQAGLSVTGLQSNVLALLASNCVTVEQALNKVCEYHGLMSSDPLPNMTHEPQTSTFTVEITRLSPRVSQHLTEMMFAIIIMMLRQMTRKPIVPQNIQLRRHRPDNSNELSAHFQCDIAFNSLENSMVFSRDVLDQAVPYADPQFLMTLERHANYLLQQYAQAITWEEKVKQALMKQIHQGDISIREIARCLNVSTRTLQQKLKTEKMSFQKILDATRKDIAIDYLKNENSSIIDLALQLGFSEQSAFNHAFKRWTGSTPTRYK